MPSYSLSTLRSQIGALANVTIQASGRYPVATINTWINTAIGRYWQLYTCESDRVLSRALLTTSASVTLSNGWPSNEFVALPADFFALKSLMLQGSTVGTKRRLTEMAESDREQYPTGVVREPEVYRLANNTAGASIARLWPACDAVYTIECLYVPTPAVLALDADTFNFLIGTEDVVICDVALRILEQDGVPEGSQYQAIAQRRNEAMQALERYSSADRATALTMRDTWSVRRQGSLNRRLGWP
jgi:hypothetical protein